MDSLQFESLCYNYFHEWNDPQTFEERLLFAVKIISMITLVPMACVGIAYGSVAAYNYFALSEEDKKIYNKANEVLDTVSEPLIQTNEPVKPESKPLPELPQETIQFNLWLSSKLPNDLDYLTRTYSAVSQKLDESSGPIICYNNGKDFAMKLNIKQINPEDKFGAIQDVSFRLPIRINDRENENEKNDMNIFPSPKLTIKTKNDVIVEISLPITFFGNSRLEITPEKAKEFVTTESKNKIAPRENLNWMVFRLLSGQSVRIEPETHLNHKFPSFEVTLAS